MGKDRANKGTQQTRMDQYTAQSAGASLQKDPPGPLEKGAEPTGVQILAAIESSSRAAQTQIAAIAVDVNLLRDDLRVVVEQSVATEQKVTCMQSDVDTLKASVAIPKAKTRKLEVHGILDRDPPKMNTKSHMTAKLQNVMRNLQFVDVWREMYPTSRIFLCYMPTHWAYSRLDRFLLANDGSLDVRRVVHQVQFLLDHAPFLLECETHIPKPAIPLWHLRPELLGDPEYKPDLQSVLNGYFRTNWGTAMACSIEWEALKVVIRGESLSKTYGIRKRLDQGLTQQEDVLAALQRQVDNGDASESDCLEVRGRIVDLWERLDNYVCRNYRQRLFREGDCSGVCWLGSSGGSVPFLSSRCSVVLLEKRF
ncbi:hypothetical protein NDU88_005324 [Pleurodeles waltl]|uniref:Uncharacterized protein n=1 Tax=Pleurodeles waltl TaxID=8319 RepID=A0AAV7QFM8_PLEWA|nr:hypothetical protein NDU88_005324 [Pleurodeles waltl]